jgi:hypothetical protein
VDTDLPLKVAGKEFKKSFLAYSPLFSRESWEIFKKEKLLVKEIAKTLTTAYDEGEYANLTGMYMVIPKNDFSFFYLLGLLNSRLLDFYFRSLYGTTHMAGGYLRFNGSYLKELPIHIPSDHEKAVIETLSRMIYDLRKQKSSQFFTQEIKNITNKLMDILNVCIYEIYLKKELKTTFCQKIYQIIHDIQTEELVPKAKKLINYTEKLSDEYSRILTSVTVRAIENIYKGLK